MTWWSNVRIQLEFGVFFFFYINVGFLGNSAFFTLHCNSQSHACHLDLMRVFLKVLPIITKETFTFFLLTYLTLYISISRYRWESDVSYQFLQFRVTWRILWCSLYKYCTKHCFYKNCFFFFFCGFYHRFLCFCYYFYNYFFFSFSLYFCYSFCFNLYFCFFCFRFCFCFSLVLLLLRME